MAKMILPIVRYRNIPIISFMVVTKGPVASAGSTFSLFSSKGMKVPNRLANTTTENMAAVTVTVSAKSSPISLL